jgi:YVTN family beta-propeller protein
VQAFDTTTFQRLAEAKTGPVPIRVIASPDGKWIVTSNLGNGSLTVIDAETRKAVREIQVSSGDAARQVTILFSADGRRVYAAETAADQVAEIDFASGSVLRRIHTGRNGDGLAIAPRPR